MRVMGTRASLILEARHGQGRGSANLRGCDAGRNALRTCFFPQTISALLPSSDVGVRISAVWPCFDPLARLVLVNRIRG